VTSGDLLISSSTGKDELLDTAMALHEAAMKDEYFIKRKLAPNVDFWCVSQHDVFMRPS
jgi:citrate synthase